MSTNSVRAMTRREFLTRGMGVIAVSSSIPLFLSTTVRALAGTLDAPKRLGEKILVVIQLGGGNDGLNTVVPLGADPYYRLRPTLAIPKDRALRINDEIGFHPALVPLKELYDQGKLVVVQNVGYPNPDRSHFRSMEIWQSGIVDGYETTGWIGRTFDHTCGNSHLRTPSPTLSISIGETLNPALQGNKGIGVALSDPEQFYRLTKVTKGSQSKENETTAPAAASQIDFLRRTAMNAEISADQIRRSVRSVQNQAAYPKEAFAQGLKLIASMIAGGMDTQIYYISLTGFDTHANQQGKHEQLLKTLAEGIGAFQRDLEALGQADRVVGFTFSEFGRRVAENGSRGTDHGQAAPLFVFGKSVKPGIVGPPPSLDKLSDGDLRFQIDFRQIYATMLENWIKTDSKAILGEKFGLLPLLG